MNTIINRIKCRWSGHLMGDFKRVSEQSIRFTCLRCQRELIYNEYTMSMIPWDEKIAAFYKRLEEIENQHKI